LTLVELGVQDMQIRNWKNTAKKWRN